MLRQISAILALSGALVGAAFIGCGDDEEKEKRDGGSARRSPAEEDGGGGLSPEDARKVLAKIDGTTITLGEFSDRINQQSPYLRSRYNSPERRREFLDNLIRFELLAQEAERRGYGNDAEVQRTLKQVMIQRLMKQDFEDRTKVEDVSETDMRKYYDEHRDEYHKPEQVRASVILVKDRAKADRLLRDILAKSGDARFFRQTAQESSEDAETKTRGGDLRYFSRPNERRDDEPPVAAEVASSAFGLKNVGDVHSELVKSGAGWNIVKLTGKRKALDRTFDEVRRTIQNRLWRERRQTEIERFVDDLRKQANVRIHEDVLGQVRLDTSMPTGAEGAPGMPAPGQGSAPGGPGEPGHP
ncbi:MAG: peptidyl-prolyl cis-trans isomerase [Deltaproteobacteria bacterium]|nr:peptidyl-prolyl cis-trans isomerase [Deltaproteobacteria bacterium]